MTRACPAILASDGRHGCCESADEPEDDEDDQDEAERAAQACSAVAAVTVIATAAAEKNQHEDDDEDCRHGGAPCIYEVLAPKRCIGLLSSRRQAPTGGRPDPEWPPNGALAFRVIQT